jgi:hypothetical protein
VDTGEYSVEGDAESFFDLNADELDENLGGDEETFGNIGPLSESLFSFFFYSWNFCPHHIHIPSLPFLHFR